MRNICTIDGCPLVVAGWGLCMRHYNQRRRGKPVGSPMQTDRRAAIIEGDVAKIPLGIKAHQGYALVDVADAWLDKYFWCKTVQGYVVRQGNGSQIKLHRQIMQPPDGMFVDHINHDPLDNRRKNLRVVTPWQNSCNTRASRNNGIGYRGVSWHKRDKVFTAQVVHHGKTYNLGYFETPEDAARAYDAKAIEFRGEYAFTNFKHGQEVL